ncbi:MAG: hypothetical protein ACLPX7_01360 [Xanthobacteraceae bacterium]
MRELPASEFGRRLAAIAVVLIALAFVGLHISVKLGVGVLVSGFFMYALLLSTWGTVLAGLIAIAGQLVEFLERS